MRFRSCQLRLLVLALGIWTAAARAFAAHSVVSQMPESASAGTSIMVTNTVTLGSGVPVQVQAIEDLLPLGWTADQVSHGGRFDAVTRKVKWGLYFDGAARALSYRATSPASASGNAAFSGLALVNSETIPITGVRSCFIFAAESAGRATAAMPTYYRAGVPFTLSETIAPAAGVKSQALEETLPPGWTAAAISHSGTFDTATRKVKWGPFADATPRVLTASILPPANANEPAVLAGVVSFDGLVLAIEGAREILPELHRVISSLPPYFRAGTSFTVTLNAFPVAGALSYAIEEIIPEGWSASAIDQGGTLHADGRAIRWGPYSDDLPRTFTYVATSPVSAVGTHHFEGRGSFDGGMIPISGARATTAFASAAVRVLPAEVTAGSSFQVTYQIQPAPGILSNALEDKIPAGFVVSAISNGGRFDTVAGELRWGPFADSEIRTVTCWLTPPASAVGNAPFFGEGSFDGVNVPITGATKVTVVNVEQANQLTRLIPATALAGETFEVRLNVAVAPSVRDYAVEDLVPAGWAVSEISHAGSFESASGKVKWGPFADNVSRLLSYRIASPASARGPYPFFATASFDGVSIFEEGSIIIFQPITVPNHPPVANGVTYIRAPNLTLKIRITELLANNTTDLEGDPRSLQSLGASGQGATITVAGGFILYNPINNNNDSFTYTIADALGRTASGRIFVNVVNAVSRALRIEATGTSVAIQFVGIPSFSYEVQRAPFVTGPWTRVATITAKADGSFSHTEIPPFTPAFYRLYQP